jgi:type II secretion system protein H
MPCSARPVGSGGFTLLEVLLVLAILGGVAALAAGGMPGLGGARLAAAADAMLAELRGARAEAIRTGSVVEVLIDPARRRWHLPGRTEWQALDPAIATLTIAPPPPTPGEPARVAFGADGAGPPVRVELRQGRHVRVILREAATGRLAPAE